MLILRLAVLPNGTIGTVGYYNVALPPESILFHYRSGIQETFVPEPTTMSLLAIALGAGWLSRRRRSGRTRAARQV